MPLKPLFTFICLLLANCVFPQNIQYLGLEQGLSNNTVMSISKDQYGFMWFGTFDGLNCFDGYSFSKFRKKIGDSTSLPDNMVFDIEEYRGQLYVATPKGLGVLNRKTNQFSAIRYAVHGAVQQSSPLLKAAVSRLEVTRGAIYIGTMGEGFLELKGADTIARQLPLLIQSDSIYNYAVSAICEEKTGDVWFVSPGGGLCRYRPKTHKIAVINSDLRYIKALRFDANGTLWVGTSFGLFIFDQQTHKLIPYLIKGRSLTASWDIKAITAEGDDLIWVATDGHGLNVIDTRLNAIVRQYGIARDNLITSNALYDVYIDEASRKWIGTMRGGINVIDPRKEIIETYRHIPYNANSLVSDNTFSFCEDGNQIWVGTDGGGISIWNRDAGTFESVRFTEDGRHPGANQITSIVKDTTGNIWMASYGSGVKIYNPVTKAFKEVPFPFPAGTAVYIFKLFIDSKQTIWAGYVKGPNSESFEKGLYRFDKNTGRFRAADVAITQDVLTIAEDMDGALWLGSENGVKCIDRSGKVKDISLGALVRAVYPDEKGNIWLGTYGSGLFKYIKKTGKLHNFTEKDGLPNDIVLNLEQDNLGNLWMSTFNGLSRFNPHNNTFENFHAADGLQSNQFNYNASLKLKSGELIFGGIKGFNIFDPGKIRISKEFPPLLLTELRVANNPVMAGSEYAPHAQNIQGIRDIVLPYNKSSFSLDFVALEYSFPKKIHYAYFLKGKDKEWNQLGNQRTINYSGLIEGDYVLMLKSTNASGIWNPGILQINVTILPPWYRSVWACLLYLLISATLIYLYINYQKEKARFKYEVMLTRMKAQQETELSEKKISFFTNIAHELRTPLTLIVNPIKDLLRNDGKNVDLVDVSSVHRNTKRLLSLVDQLLLFRHMENEVSALKPAVINLTEVCEEVLLCFNDQAKRKSVSCVFENQAGQLKVYADQEKIEIVLFNLISNAIKYSETSGTVLLSLKEENGCAKMAVKNNGTPIPEETGNKLFDKFFRMEQHVAKRSGFGIGLFVSRRIAELQSGSLSYISNQQEGTIFTYLIPVHAEDIRKSEGVDDSRQNNKNSELLHELFQEDVETMNPDRTIAESMDHVYDELIANKPNVLVAEDDDEMRMYLYQLLKDDYNTFVVGSAEDAWEKLSETEIDIILSDIVMPGKSGVEFCSTVKDSVKYSHIPVILLTGTSSPEVKLKGIECGADDYVTKPFEKELLLARIKSILKGRDILKSYFFNEVTLQHNTGAVSEEYSAFLKKAVEITENHLKDSDFNVKVFIKEMGMSRSNVFRKVKAISGLSISEFIRYIRLKKAAELMIRTDIRVKEVAYEVGINDPRYFREQFSKIFGVNPSDYIKKYRQPLR